MLFVDRETRDVHEEMTSPELQAIGHVVVDGTHSGGKTTLIQDYVAQKELLPDDGADFGTKHGFTYPYVCVTENVDGIEVPVVISSEAALSRAQKYPWRKMLTEEYNTVDQGAITFHAALNIVTGASYAARMADKLQPNAALPFGVTLSDRGPLSGYVYADTRLPGYNHDVFDMRDFFDLSGPTPTYTNLRPRIEAFVSTCDLAVIPSHKRVKFEASEYREEDLELRRQIARGVHAAYRERVEKVATLSGSRPERRSQFQAVLRAFIRTRLTQQ